MTDGACTEVEIMTKELIIMKSLNWELSPATANCWLGIYMQLANALEDKEGIESKENSSSTLSRARAVLEVKQFSSHTFVQAARLLDLATMDLLSLRYPYSAIAAAAVYHTVGERTALTCSGYTWEHPDTQCRPLHTGTYYSKVNHFKDHVIHHIYLHYV